MSSKSGKKRSSSKSQPEPPGRPRLCRMVKGAGGYGFNLHSKQGQHGQYIRGIDPGSPAEVANLRKGDRLIEVNGVNIERETHAQVVTRIKSGGDRTALLVVDNELDQHNKKYALTVDAKAAEESQFIEEGAPAEAAKMEEAEPKVNGDATTPEENGVTLTPVVAAVAVTQEEAEPERIEEPVEVSSEESVPLESVPNDVHATAEEAEVEETARQPEEDAMEPEIIVAVAAAEVESTPEPIREPSPERDSSSDSERESSPEPEPERDSSTESEPEPEPAVIPAPLPVVVDEPDHSKSKAPSPPEPKAEPKPEPKPEPKVEPAPVKPKAVEKAKASKPERPAEAPQKGGLDLSDMAKARALAAGKKKKKAASSADWKSKYNAFQNLK